MHVISRHNLVRLFLNVLFVAWIFWVALINSADSEIAPGHVLLYNFLLFIPAWVNNFYLLPQLGRTKRAGRYLGTIVLVFLACSWIAGEYLNWMQIRYHTHDLSDFTPLGITSSAPHFLRNFQFIFDAFPAILILLIVFVVAYVIREFLRKLKKEKYIQNEQTLAELNLLKSQISPHFLFNVLNSLYSLSLKKSDQTPDVILKLSDILRYSLYETQEREVSVLGEVAIIETYIAIEKMRISESAEILFTHEGIDETIKIAPMLLLPLVENAFKHGVDSTVDDSYIHASLQKSGNRLVFTCENTFKEFKASKPGKVGGIGIRNIRKRLELLYPDRHQMDMKSRDGIFQVTVMIVL